MASHWIWGDRIRRVIVLDTNALLSVFEFSINLVDELAALVGNAEIVIPQAVVDELHHIIKNSEGVKRQKAQAALQFADRFSVISHDPSYQGDEALLHVADEVHGMVVTNDKELRARLKQAGIRTIFLRGKQRLSLE